MRCPHGLAWFAVAILSVFIESASAQGWLTDQSYRPNSQSLAPLPTVPDQGLLEPPPPLEPELPPSVFDQPRQVELADHTPPTTVWAYPWTWFPTDGWSNSVELGINGSDGNAQSFSFQTGARFKRETDFTLFDFRVTHNRTNANGVETQNNALMYADFERFLGDSAWTSFVKNGLEYDEFRAFDLRYNINAGLGYGFYRTDRLTVVGRLGAGASREFGGPDDAWSPEALLGGDYEHQVTDRHKLIVKVDYFPEWSNFNNFRLVSDVAWEYLVDEEGNLSLKLGANDRYDSTPNGLKPNDINYSALLLYKF